MQFFIKKFYDYESKIKIEERKLAINIDNNDMIIESTRQKDENGNFIELFKKRIIGWHNIQIKDKEYRKYTSDSMNYIEVHTDILFKTNGEYKIIHYVFGIRPLLTYDVYGFFDYLKEYTANSLTDEQLKMIEKVKLLELEEKQKRKKEREERKIKKLQEEEERKIKKLQEEKELKLKLLKQKREEEANKRKAERIEVKNFKVIFNNIRNDREIEKIFTNYFSKYIGDSFLNTDAYSYLITDLIINNSKYQKVKQYIPRYKIEHIKMSQTVRQWKAKYDETTSRYDAYEDVWEVECNKHLKLNKIDNIIDFIKIKIEGLNDEYVRLIVGVEICDVAISYYSNKFYEMYGKELTDMEGLNLNECIAIFINSDFYNEYKEKKGMFIYYLMSLNKFEEKDFKDGYLRCSEVFDDIYKALQEKKSNDSFINSILTHENENENENESIYSIDDIDLMTGIEFEIFIGKLFKKMGYKTSVTKASGDQGIDVIAEKQGVRYGIQAKRYLGSVSNSAIQQVVAGIAFYKCDKGIVITNNYFSSSAIELARANQVILWDRHILKSKIKEFNEKILDK